MLLGFTCFVRFISEAVNGSSTEWPPGPVHLPCVRANPEATEPAFFVYIAVMPSEDMGCFGSFEHQTPSSKQPEVDQASASHFNFPSWLMLPCNHHAVVVLTQLLLSSTVLGPCKASSLKKFSIQTLRQSQQTVERYVLKLPLGDTQSSVDLAWVKKEGTTVFHTWFTPLMRGVSACVILLHQAEKWKIRCTACRENQKSWVGLLHW